MERFCLCIERYLRNERIIFRCYNEICRGKRGINADMAMKLSKALGGSPQFWLNLQNNWELSRLNSSNFENISSIAA